MGKRLSVKIAVFVLLVASAVLMCACLPFKPPKPSKTTIERAVKAESGLDCRLIRQIDDEIIKKQRYLWKKHKLFCLLKKHGSGKTAALFSKASGLETVFG